MKSCLLLILSSFIFQVSFGQQFVSYKATPKFSGEVLAASPSRKMGRINNNRNETSVKTVGINDAKNSIDFKDNICNISYSISENKDYKYNTHIEGQIKDCNTQTPISHAYVSLNSSVEQGKFIIVATNTEGYFSIDVTDDYVGGITLFKKGYTDKELPLVAVSEIDTKKLYPLTNACLLGTF